MFQTVAIADRLPALQSSRPQPPQSRLIWSSLADWTRAAYALSGHADGAQRARKARAHWLALPLFLFEAAPAGACRDFLWLIEQPESRRAPWGKPARTGRADTKWQDAERRARLRLDRLARAVLPHGSTARAARAAAPFDRSAIMRDAHKRFRDGRRLGLDWTFPRCLKTAWAAHRLKAQA